MNSKIYKEVQEVAGQLQIASQIIEAQSDAMGMQPPVLHFHTVLMAFPSLKKILLVNTNQATVVDLHQWAEMNKFDPAAMQIPLPQAILTALGGNLAQSQDNTDQLAAASVQPSDQQPAVDVQPSDQQPAVVVQPSDQQPAVDLQTTDQQQPVYVQPDPQQPAIPVHPAVPMQAPDQQPPISVQPTDQQITVTGQPTRQETIQEEQTPATTRTRSSVGTQSETAEYGGGAPSAEGGTPGEGATAANTDISAETSQILSQIDIGYVKYLFFTTDLLFVSINRSSY